MILVLFPIYSLNLSFPFARESKGFHHKSSFLTDHWSVNQGIATKPEIPIIRNCDLLLEQGRVQSAKIGTASLSTAEVQKRSIKKLLKGKSDAKRQTEVPFVPNGIDAEGSGEGSTGGRQSGGIPDDSRTVPGST